MKLLSPLFFLFFVSSGVCAQDTIKKFQAPSRFTKKLNVPKKMSVQEIITHEINKRLDSLANKSTGDRLLVSTVRVEIENILYPYWKSGDLKGANISQAYYIQAGLQTMTQRDVEAGRLILLVGIAPNRPAEFISIRFEQLLRNKKIVLNK